MIIQMPVQIAYIRSLVAKLRRDRAMGIESTDLEYDLTTLEAVLATLNLVEGMMQERATMAAKLRAMAGSVS